MCYKPIYGDQTKLAYTDTDNFVIHIEREDLYKDSQQTKSYMNFSDYPKSHCKHDHANKKVLGKFKDERNVNIITEFVALRPNMYAFQVEGRKEQKRAKDVPKNVIKHEMNFDLYKKSLKKITYPR